MQLKGKIALAGIATLFTALGAASVHPQLEPTAATRPAEESQNKISLPAAEIPVPPTDTVDEPAEETAATYSSSTSGNVKRSSSTSTGGKQRTSFSGSGSFSSSQNASNPGEQKGSARRSSGSGKSSGGSSLCGMPAMC